MKLARPPRRIEQKEGGYEETFHDAIEAVCGVRGNRMLKDDRISPVAGWSWRLHSVSPYRGRFFEPLLIVAFIFLLANPVAKDSQTRMTLKALRAQEFVDQLRTALQIRNDVQISVVIYQPLVFSVQPMDSNKDRFLLTMELGFLLMLEDDELRAAVAHELGHVWIYTHHPFLQTESLANIVGQRVAGRASFEKIYTKLWAYEGTSGVPMEDLLGPSSGALDILGPAS